MNKTRTCPMDKAAHPPLADKGTKTAVVLFPGFTFNAVDNGLQEIIVIPIWHAPFQNDDTGRKAQGFPEDGFGACAGFVRDKGKDRGIKGSVGKRQREPGAGKGRGRAEAAPGHSQHGRGSINAKSPNARSLKNVQLLPGAAADIKYALPVLFLTKRGNPLPGGCQETGCQRVVIRCGVRIFIL